VSSVAPVSESEPLKKPLAWWAAGLIALAILVLFALMVSYVDEKAGRGLGVLFALAFGIWVEKDARRINLRQYKTHLPVRSMGVCMFFLWLPVFPWYLVVRSKIRAGVMPKLENVGPAPSGSALRVVGWACGGLIIVLTSAALFINSGTSIKGVWQTTDAQLAAANMAVGTPTSQAATDAPKPSESAVEGDSAVISVVTNGILANYNTTTVGKAFEGTFQGPKWTTFVSPKGVTVVQFDGTITALKLTEQGFVEFDGIYKRPASELVDGCIEKLGLSAQRAQFNMDWLATTPSSTLLSTKPLDVQHYNIQKCVAAQVAIPVQFQFVLSADHTSFQIGYLDETPFKVNGRCNVEKVFGFIYQ